MNGGYIFKAMDDERNLLTFYVVRDSDLVSAKSLAERIFGGGIVELVKSLNSDEIGIWIKAFAMVHVIFSKGTCVNMATFPSA